MPRPLRIPRQHGVVMFPTGGFFKGIPCPFFEHGLCHRAKCHYSHSKSTQISKRLSRLASSSSSTRLTVTNKQDNTPCDTNKVTLPPPLPPPLPPTTTNVPTVTVSNVSIVSTATSDSPPIAVSSFVCETSVSSSVSPESSSSNLVPSSSLNTSPLVPCSSSIVTPASVSSLPSSSSTTVSTCNTSSIVPKVSCVSSDTISSAPTTSSSLVATEMAVATETTAPTNKASVDDVNLLSSPSPPVSPPTNQTLHEDIFGSCSDSEVGDDNNNNNDIHSPVVSMDTDEPRVDMEVEFLKATSVEVRVEPVSKEGGVGGGSKTKAKYENEGVKKRRIAHSNKITRSSEAVSSSVRPKSLGDMKLLETLKDPGAVYVSKKRLSRATGGNNSQSSKSKSTTLTKTDAGVIKRPRLQLVINAKVPTKLRQGYLDMFIDEHIKKGTEPSLAYKRSLDEEEQLLKRSASQTIYRNLCSHHLRSLRKEAEEVLRERRRRSDERVPTSTGDDAMGGAKSEEGVIKHEATKKEIKSEAGIKSKVGVASETGVATKTDRFDVTNKSHSSKGNKSNFDASSKAIKRNADTIDVSEDRTDVGVVRADMGVVKTEVQPDKESEVISIIDDDEPVLDPMNTSTSSSDSCILVSSSSSDRPHPQEDKPLPSSGVDAKSFYSSKRKSREASSEHDSSKKRKKEDNGDKKHTFSFESMLMKPDRKMMKKKQSKHQIKQETSQTATSRLATTTSTSSTSGWRHITDNKLLSRYGTDIDCDDDDKRRMSNIATKRKSCVSSGSTNISTSTGTKERDGSKRRDSDNRSDCVAMSDSRRSDHTLNTSTGSSSKKTVTSGDDIITIDNDSFEVKEEQGPLTTPTASPTQSPKPPLDDDQDRSSTTDRVGVGDETKGLPSFQPVSPSSLINLTALATATSAATNSSCRKKLKIDSRPVARKFEIVRPKPHPPPSYSIIIRKEPEFNIDVFYNQLLEYSLSEEQLTSNGYPRPTDEVGVASLKTESSTRSQIEPVGENAFRHTCCRCQKPFVIYNNGSYQTVEECMHHYGRLYKTREYGEGVVSQYNCCGGRIDSPGCQVAQMHVTAGVVASTLSGCVQSAPPPQDGGYDPMMYALDCEMCYTTAGPELTRITVIDWKLNTIYDTIVKPDHPIVDYNTRFSGLKAEDFIGITTSLTDVQSKLSEFVYEDTILIGHSLESDLKAIKFIHSTVVDTAIVFPHRKGPPFKRALKSLAAELLHKFIQDSVDDGHDSREDSIVCMELMIMKVKADLKQMKR